MKEKTMKWIIAVLAVLLLAGVAAYAATTYGSKDDPLITKSYLDEVVKPQLAGELEAKLDEALRCAAGCQILPVSGSVTAAGALSDTTAGEAVAAGAALSANHLYMATDDGGVTAAGAATVLVSGTYSID